MSLKIINYSMPRGDSRTLPVSVPLSVYSEGASIFFNMKKTIDNLTTDALGVCPKILTDDDITSTDDSTVNYLLNLLPSDTNIITPGDYFAEFEFVSLDKLIVITYPDPDPKKGERFKITITGDVVRTIDV